MPLSAEDRCEICDTIALHGHLVDAGAHDRLVEVFTPDLDLDLSGVGLKPVPIADRARALEVYIAAGKRRGTGSTISMHVTNTVVRGDGAGAKAWSKAIIVDISGSVSCYTYEDQLIRTAQGWRVRRRRIDTLQEPGSGLLPAPRRDPNASA